MVKKPGGKLRILVWKLGCFYLEKLIVLSGRVSKHCQKLGKQQVSGKKTSRRQWTWRDESIVRRWFYNGEIRSVVSTSFFMFFVSFSLPDHLHYQKVLLFNILKFGGTGEIIFAPDWKAHRVLSYPGYCFYICVIDSSVASSCPFTSSLWLAVVSDKEISLKGSSDSLQWKKTNLETLMMLDIVHNS